MRSDIFLQNGVVIFTGGGTGGHLWPLVSIIEKAKRDFGITPIYFGSSTLLERKILRKIGIRLIYIPSGKKRAYFDLRNLFSPLWILLGILKSLCWLLILRPAFVFGKGGYAMLPVAIAAKFVHIPVISHESDIVMGETNKFVLNSGSMILTAFPIDLYNTNPKQKDRLRYTGMAVHPGFYPGLGWNQKDSSNKNADILIFGGSQGAERINKTMAAIWERLSNIGTIAHVTGSANYLRYRKMLATLPQQVRAYIKLIPEIDTLPDLIKSSKVVVCRSGSTSLWEAIEAGKEIVTIPLPEAKGDHQRLNALWLAQEFANVKVLEEKDLTPDSLYSHVVRAMHSPHKISKNSQMVLPKEGLDNIVRVLGEVLHENYLSYKRRFHLVGIRGVSMQGIKSVLQQQGHIVTGSDLMGGGHRAQNVPSNIDALVYSSATAMKDAPGNIEINEARRKNIPVFKRSAFINFLCGSRKVVAVSGMHGKSTTASMIAHILKISGLNPSYFIGVPGDDDKNVMIKPAYWGTGNTVIIEACEYDKSFCDFNADAAVVTNIEPEHLDYFKGGIKEIEKSFIEFLSQSRPGCVVISGSGDKSSAFVLEYIKKQRPDIKVINAKITSNNLDERHYTFFGKHIKLDAEIAVMVAREWGVSEEDARDALLTFAGAKRRMEYVGKYKDADIYDDYGHHPTEIIETLNAIKQKYPGKKIYLIFEPHQTSRTKLLYDDFIKSLSKADFVIITDIYQVAGREEKIKVTSQMLADSINKKKPDRALYIEKPYQNIIDYIRKSDIANGVIVTMGATDIYKVAEELVEK